MECWIWEIYFAKTQRTFIVTLFGSDLFNMNKDVFLGVDTYQKDLPPNERRLSDEERLWRKLINMSELVVNKLGDVHIKIDTFQEPIKEKLV